MVLKLFSKKVNFKKRKILEFAILHAFGWKCTPLNANNDGKNLFQKLFQRGLVPVYNFKILDGPMDSNFV